MRIGFHFPFSGSLTSLEKKIRLSRGNTFQIFSRTLRGGKIKKIQPNKLQYFKDFLLDTKISPVIVHAPYTYNFSQPMDNETIEMVCEDLAFCEQIGAVFYVIQPGYTKKSTEEEALRFFSENISAIFSKTSFPGEIIIRNMAGAGSEFGYRVDQMQQLVCVHPRLSLGFDFARAFLSGEIIDATTWDRLEESGLSDRIRIIFVHDSNRGRGTRKNYYASLGDGLIGYGAICSFLQHPTCQEKVWLIEDQTDILQMDHTLSLLLDILQTYDNGNREQESEQRESGEG